MVSTVLKRLLACSGSWPTTPSLGSGNLTANSNEFSVADADLLKWDDFVPAEWTADALVAA